MFWTERQIAYIAFSSEFQKNQLLNKLLQYCNILLYCSLKAVDVVIVAS